jgi:hypothetical protein
MRLAALIPIGMERLIKTFGWTPIGKSVVPGIRVSRKGYSGFNGDHYQTMPMRLG